MREDVWRDLVDLARDGGLVALTGAGLSTESGIPDYRGPDGRRRNQPMTVSDLLATPQARQRYWARSYVGWPRFAAAAPNAGHRAVAALQRQGAVTCIITQNVDGLQQQAGGRDVVELHGNLDTVVCMNCGERYERASVDEWMAEANPDFDRSVEGPLRPDGDVLLSDDLVAQFRPARCIICGSDKLKPDVVMFGESVAKPLVEQCFSAVEASRGLLVLGSSLAVMSGYRFVRRAARVGLPVAVITHGWTRGEAETSLKIDAPLGATLTRLVAELGGGPAR
ncbi:NAD-dependent protein deacetylase 1 [Leekyejoonella antrihumi]|uniref:protein acetyllysine N-acetyltransferase n=2 Tax=Leekyejoonella antrihumi TaxID=1660198 RepID=A0A563E667_9MICO|nr:NAD-dependent protein deacetylase 1 [Leekyejoonella antrihumi]